MRTDLELITARLVDVRRTENIETLEAGGKGNRAANDGASTFGGINDFLSGLVDKFVIVGLQANTDALGLNFLVYPAKKNIKRTTGSGVYPDPVHHVN